MFDINASAVGFVSSNLHRVGEVALMLCNTKPRVSRALFAAVPYPRNSIFNILEDSDHLLTAANALFSLPALLLCHS